MTRRTHVNRVGPPTATLHRRVTAAGRAGSLALLVEVWGVGDTRHRQAIERGLAEGMANVFERRDGGVTARLKLALQAGDRWLRRVVDAEPEALASLGAGASLLWCGSDEAILAQAGPAVAFALDLAADAELVSPADLPEAVRHPAASPWLRRGVEAMTPDALWPPLGMGEPGRLEIHWAHWPFPPGAAALLAPSVAAEILRRDVVGPILSEPPEQAARAFDETLPDGLPALLVSHPRPPDAQSTEIEEEALDLTRRFEAVPWETGPQALGAEIDAAEQLPLPRPADGTTVAEVAAAAAAERRRLMVDRADAVIAVAPDPRIERPQGMPGERFSPRDELASTMASVSLALRRLVVRAARGGAKVIVSILPQRERVGANSYAVETARLAAATVLSLPILALLLIWIMSVRAADPPAGGPPVGSAAPALTVPVDDPPELAIRRLDGLLPAANLVGEAGSTRRLAVGDGGAYVLDSDLDRVDRLSLAPASEGGGFEDPTPRESLAKTRSIGASTVGALDDIFWLAPPGDGPDEAASGRAVALDAAGTLWSMDEREVAPLPLSAEPGWTAVSHAAGFDGRIYALDRSTSQIYRYTATGGEWPSFSLAGEPWLADGGELAGSIDLAIDGAVYVLQASGDIRKYAGGQALDFAVRDVPGGIIDAVAIHAAPPEGDLLVADRGGRRILVLAADGGYRGQLLRPPQTLADDDGGFDQLSDLWWDEDAGLIYIVAGKTLWAAPFTGMP